MRVLAVASSGGHWVQLKRLVPAFSDTEVLFISTNKGHESEVNGKFFCVRDASAWSKLSLVVMFFQILFIIARYKPDVVVTTGAAPGLAAIIIGHFFKARTVWVDSIANAETISKSGMLAKRFCTAWVSQWKHLAEEHGCEYWGGVL